MDMALRTVGCIAAALAVGAVFFAVKPQKSDTGKEESTTLRSRRVATKTGENAPKRESHKVPLSKNRGDKGWGTEGVVNDAGRIQGTERVDEESQFVDKVIDDLISQLNDFAGSKDLPRLLALVRRILDNPQGVLGKATIPVRLKKAILQALGCIGPDAAAEVVEMMSDPEPEVSEMALSELRSMLHRYGIGDRVKSAIVVAAATQMEDPFDVKCVFKSIKGMRPSVAYETALAISQTGTETAKSLLNDTISSYTGMYGTSTVEGMQEWLEQNPDPPNAEKRFGPKR